MNLDEYKGALDRMVPAPHLKDRIRDTLDAPAPIVRPRRRAGRAVLAAAAAVACTVLVAMAASPELRTAVLTFLRLEEAEQVPVPTGDRETPELTQSTIDQQVEAQYISLPSGFGWSYGDGVLYQAEQADDGSILAFHYWTIGADGLIPLETRATAFSTLWDGVTYTDTVYWCEYQGEVSCYNNGTAGMALDYDCTVSTLEGRTDVVLLTLSQGSQINYREYPVLLDLATGEVTDLLEGTGWETAAPLTEVQWAGDLSAAILSSDRTGWYYCDRTAGTTVSLNQLTGLEVFSAYFAHGSTLILLTRSGPDGDCYDIWTWQPDSGTLTQTFSQLPAYQRHEEHPYGFQFFFGGGRGIYVAEDGALSVLDLRTGGTTAVEGFSLAQWSAPTFLANCTGSRVLFANYDGQAEGLGVSNLGVMDLEAGTFTLLDRDSSADLYEASLGWFDENRVAIWGHASEDFTQACLYLYRF